MTDRRLGPSKSPRRSRYGAFAQQCIEHYQQVQVHPGKIHSANVMDECNRLEELICAS
jgi:hypothetical protein